MVGWDELLSYWPLVFANGIIDTLLGLLIGVLVVARIAARRAKVEWTTWLMSKDAEPYMDKLALRVIKQLPSAPVIPPFPPIPKVEDFMEAIEPRIAGLEERINQPIDLDLGPIVKEVTENVVREVDKVRAVIDGKIGYLAKVEKQGGEAIAQEVVNQAMEDRGINPNGAQGRLYKRLKALMADSKWQKANPAAAAGVDAVLGEMEEGLSTESGTTSSVTRTTRRVGR